MANVVKKLYVDGREVDVAERMTLDQMQRFVGGTIEQVPSNTARRALIVNENGAINGISLVNRRAIAYAHPSINVIYGDALLIKA